MTRLIIGLGLIGLVAVIAFIAGFAFSSWGYQEQARKERGRWN